MADNRELENWINHEKRLTDLESVVDSLHWHHRNDRTQERLNETSERARQALATAERAEAKIMKIADSVEASASRAEAAVKKINGNGQHKDTETRLRWVERILWGALGAVAMFELMARVWKPGG